MAVAERDVDVEEALEVNDLRGFAWFLACFESLKISLNKLETALRRASTLNGVEVTWCLR